jgi:hypothetical protein
MRFTSLLRLLLPLLHRPPSLRSCSRMCAINKTDIDALDQAPVDPCQRHCEDELSKQVRLHSSNHSVIGRPTEDDDLSMAAEMRSLAERMSALETTFARLKERRTALGVSISKLAKFIAALGSMLGLRDSSYEVRVDKKGVYRLYDNPLCCLQASLRNH